MNGISRRQFLEMAAAVPAGICVTPPLWASPCGHATKRFVLIVDLVGGNDGWNTLVRPGDAHYRSLRPGLSLPGKSLVPLGSGVGLHPALAPLAGAWHAGELALCEGVGESAGRSAHLCAAAHFEPASGSSLGHGLAGAAGLGTPEAPDWTQATLASDAGLADSGGVLASVAGPGSQRSVAATPLQRFRAQHGPALLPHGGRPVQCLRSGLEHAVRELGRPQPAALLRVAQHGYDTHVDQASRHATCLAELADGLAWLRGRLRAAGLWQRVLVMTRSEIGRSLAENSAGGTDHGALGVRFLMGGGLRGGLYGARPDPQLAGRPDFQPALRPADFARLLARDWWRNEIAGARVTAAGALDGIV